MGGEVRSRTHVRIGAAQLAQSSDIKANCESALRCLDAAADEGVEIVCFPEAHLSGYRVDITPSDVPLPEKELEACHARVAERCGKHGIACLIGSEWSAPLEKPRNTVLVIDERGDIVGRHDKTILTPLDAVAYSPGEGFGTWCLHGTQVGVVICFEGFRFAHTTRECVLKGAQIVFHPQNNTTRTGVAWKLPVHEAMIVTRAAENTVFFVSVNMACEHQNSRSLIVGPDGTLRGATRLQEEELLVRDLDLSEATRAMACFQKNGIAEMLFGRASNLEEHAGVEASEMRREGTREFRARDRLA